MPKRTRDPEDTQQPLYEVEYIIAAQRTDEPFLEGYDNKNSEYYGSGWVYHVKWKDYPDTNWAWQPSENLKKCQFLIREFWEDVGLNALRTQCPELEFPASDEFLTRHQGFTSSPSKKARRKSSSPQKTSPVKREASPRKRPSLRIQTKPVASTSRIESPTTASPTPSSPTDAMRTPATPISPPLTPELEVESIPNFSPDDKPLPRLRRNKSNDIMCSYASSEDGRSDKQSHDDREPSDSGDEDSQLDDELEQLVAGSL
ncbi:hypothetical protein R3P38DRAFT_3252650 [Favolaschia claudopus]|uniref:Chromo domain-containing protein n=1 Tax=Favolaschia claudopus TaxID=2862362 RepID=A0AAW0DZ48_9AGAR